MTAKEHAKVWWDSLGPDGQRHCSKNFPCIDNQLYDEGTSLDCCDFCQELALAVVTHYIKYLEVPNAK